MTIWALLKVSIIFFILAFAPKKTRQAILRDVLKRVEGKAENDI